MCSPQLRAVMVAALCSRDTPRMTAPAIAPVGDRYDTVTSRELRGTVSVPEDVLLHIVENSPVGLLLVWRRTSRAFYRTASVGLRRRYDDCISPFVTNLELFDETMRRHGAVISGSIALYYFLPAETWLPRDIDIYVPDHTFDSFIAVAMSSIGLRFTELEEDDERHPTLSGSAEPRPGLVKEVRHLLTPTKRHVDIIRSTTCSPLTPLHGFWSSLVKNFLTPDAAVCAFPEATMNRCGFIKNVPLNRRDRRAVMKYLSRGFCLALEPEDDWLSGAGEAYAGLQRHFGDKHSLVVDFRPDILSPPSTLPVLKTSWGWYIVFRYPPLSSFNDLDNDPSLTSTAHGGGVALEAGS